MGSKRRLTQSLDFGSGSHAARPRLAMLCAKHFTPYPSLSLSNEMGLLIQPYKYILESMRLPVPRIGITPKIIVSVSNNNAVFIIYIFYSLL